MDLIQVAKGIAAREQSGKEERPRASDRSIATPHSSNADSKGSSSCQPADIGPLRNRSTKIGLARAKIVFLCEIKMGKAQESIFDQKVETRGSKIAIVTPPVDPPGRTD